MAQSKSSKFTVIGGGGYIGFHIGIALWQRGHTVTLFDIAKPDSFWLTTALSDEDGQSLISNSHASNGKSSLTFVQGSLLDVTGLNEAIKGTDCVIHCASYGMSGKEQMPTEWDKTEEVNITGTENVIKACLTSGARGLVYTSSYNVVFGGQEIVNGDESLPYFPLHKHVDHYSRTKAIAERLILSSDDLSSGGSETVLRTCALRLAGVFGLGERRHLPRIVKVFGLAMFKYGYGDSLQQFLTLKNVVQAHVKAAEQVLANPQRLGGQAYFISDEVPINSFDFLQPLRDALGYAPPSFMLPMWALWMVVYAIQAVYCVCSAIHPSLRFTPLLTPAEVFKTGVTHWFSCEKAKRDFGYLPEKSNDISDVIQYYRERMKDEENDSTNYCFHMAKYLLVFLFISMCYFCIYS